MRALLAGLGLPLALALWGGLWWWGLPYGVSVHLTPRLAPTAAPAAPAVWRLEVTAPFPHLEGLAVGDRVQFDRYGVLAPTRGSVACVPGTAPLVLTPVGGRVDHAGHVTITRAPAGAPGCERPARAEPVVSLQP